MSERICPQCSRSFGSDISFCPDDGHRLIGETSAGLSGMVVEGRFTVEQLLARGGMGSVYIAEQHSMSRQIALKVLRPEFSENLDAVKRFLAEARLASRLTNPHTISLYDFGRTEDGLLYIAMELLRGATLRAILESDGPFSEPRALSVAAQMCESLAEAHAIGLVHRDVKPDNVFLLNPGSPREFVKVLDFGIAKSLDSSAEMALTKTGMICGTPEYMSPENVTGKGVSPASDVYSVGVMLYQMLCGKAPFQGETPMDVMVKHVQGQVEPLRGQMGDRPLSEGTAQLVARCLAKRPADRPQDASELLTELLALEQDLPRAPRITGATAQVEPPAPVPVPAAAPVPAASPNAAETSIVLPQPIASETALAARALKRRPWVGVVATGLVLAVVVVVLVLRSSATSSSEGSEASAPPETSAAASIPSDAGSTEGSHHDAAEPPEDAHAVAGAVTAEAPVAPVDAGAADTPIGVPDAAPDAVEVAAEADAGPIAPKSEVPEPRERPTARPREVRVASTPPGAEVFHGKAMLGHTPLDVTVPHKGLTVTLKMPGYEPKRMKLTTDGPEERSHRLVPNDETALKKASLDGLK